MGVLFDGGEDQMAQEDLAGIAVRPGGALHDHGAVAGIRRLHYGLHLFHVGVSAQTDKNSHRILINFSFSFNLLG
jgi:hypothetical protein